MKKIASMLLVVAIAWAVPNLMASWDAAEIEAKGVLLRYLDALGQGDVHTLQSLMAGDLLESRALLLANPQWPAYLGSTLGDAEFAVERIETVGPDRVAVEVSIIFGEDDVLVRRFVLQRETANGQDDSPFRVVEEHDPGLR
jgi:hypothetical protein